MGNFHTCRRSRTRHDDLSLPSIRQQQSSNEPSRSSIRREARCSTELSQMTTTSNEDIRKLYQIDPNIIGNLSSS